MCTNEPLVAKGAPERPWLFSNKKQQKGMGKGKQRSVGDRSVSHDATVCLIVVRRKGEGKAEE